MEAQQASLSSSSSSLSSSSISSSFSQCDASLLSPKLPVPPSPLSAPLPAYSSLALGLKKPPPLLASSSSSPSSPSPSPLLDFSGIKKERPASPGQEGGASRAAWREQWWSHLQPDRRGHGLTEENHAEDSKEVRRFEGLRVRGTIPNSRMASPTLGHVRL